MKSQDKQKFDYDKKPIQEHGYKTYKKVGGPELLLLLLYSVDFRGRKTEVLWEISFQ
jgi:hypothetical protein